MVNPSTLLVLGLLASTTVVGGLLSVSFVQNGTLGFGFLNSSDSSDDDSDDDDDLDRRGGRDNGDDDDESGEQAELDEDELEDEDDDLAEDEMDDDIDGDDEIDDDDDDDIEGEGDDKDDGPDDNNKLPEGEIDNDEDRKEVAQPGFDFDIIVTPRQDASEITWIDTESMRGKPHQFVMRDLTFLLNVTTLVISGESRQVTLEAPACECGLGWRINPSSGVPPFTSTLEVWTWSNSPLGNYEGTIIGRTEDGIERSGSFFLFIYDFQVSVDPSEVTMEWGESADFNVTIDNFGLGDPGFGLPSFGCCMPMWEEIGDPTRFGGDCECEKTRYRMIITTNVSATPHDPRERHIYAMGVGAWATVTFSNGMEVQLARSGSLLIVIEPLRSGRVGSVLNPVMELRLSAFFLFNLPSAQYWKVSTSMQVMQNLQYILNPHSEPITR